jgi:endonuclease/exonuclease/phosphatase family metal-dependent hydrolase
MRLSVLTLNLWNVSEPLDQRMAVLTAGLRHLRPDIICLQEVASDPRSGRRQSELAAEAAGLPHGVDKDALSILSRYPVVRSDRAVLPEFGQDGLRHALMAEILVNGHSLLVANTHFTWRLEMLTERKAQAEALLDAIARFGSAGTAQAKILCGDFNDDPDSPAVHLVQDSAQGFLPADPGFTFALKNPFVYRTHPRDQRIDYIFVAGDLTPDRCAVVFDGGNGIELASDHYGVFCKLTF